MNCMCVRAPNLAAYGRSSPLTDSVTHNVRQISDDSRIRRNTSAFEKLEALMMKLNNNRVEPGTWVTYQ